MGVRFKLIEQDGKPAVEFEDGDIVFQDEPLADFLMHVEILMPDLLQPGDNLEIIVLPDASPTTGLMG